MTRTENIKHEFNQIVHHTFINDHIRLKYMDSFSFNVLCNIYEDYSEMFEELDLAIKNELETEAGFAASWLFLLKHANFSCSEPVYRLDFRDACFSLYYKLVNLSIDDVAFESNYSLKRLIQGINTENFQESPKSFYSFWDNYICRGQESTKKNPMVTVTCKKDISGNPYLYKSEVPFYILLYFVYSQRSDLADDTYNALKDTLTKYHKWNNINPCLEWCITFFKDIFDSRGLLSKIFDIFDLGIATYTLGINSFLEHFSYYEHRGRAFIGNMFLEHLTLIEGYISIHYDHLCSHYSFHTVASLCNYLTGRPILKSPRKDEIQQEFTNYTRHIKERLEEYFYAEIDLSQFMNDDSKDDIITWSQVFLIAKCYANNPLSFCIFYDLAYRFLINYASDVEQVNSLCSKLNQFATEIVEKFYQNTNETLPDDYNDLADIAATVLDDTLYHLYGKSCFEYLNQSSAYIKKDALSNDVIEAIIDTAEKIKELSENPDSFAEKFYDVIQEHIKSGPYSENDWTEFMQEYFLQSLCDRIGIDDDEDNDCTE